jgi:hypothetical protein
MTSNNGRRRVAGALAGSAIAAALIVGGGTPIALADTTTETEAPPAPTMTGDQAIAQLQAEYDTGAGGGQISNFIHEVVVLRNQGYKPSKANSDAIVAAMDKRPNQQPLIDALKATVSYQRKIEAQVSAQQQQGGQGIAIGGAPAPFTGGQQIMPNPG